MDHDRLFKELLTTFFSGLPGECSVRSWRSIWTPARWSSSTRKSSRTLPTVSVTRWTWWRRPGSAESPLGFLIHVEAQARQQNSFPQRMFTYFARFHEKYGLPVYPIALFSFQTPKEPEPDEYRD